MPEGQPPPETVGQAERGEAQGDHPRKGASPLGRGTRIARIRGYTARLDFTDCWDDMAVSTMKTVSVVFGTRPGAVKLAPVILELRKRRDIRARVCAAARHRGMPAPVLDGSRIEPGAGWGLLRGGRAPAGFAARV